MARVLFIEDSPGWQDILRKLLETAGHEAHRATTCEVAIGILSGKQQFDVIVFDLLLGEEFPSPNSFVWLDALIHGIRARKLKVPPIIIVTGVDVTKQEIIQAFTEYRGDIFWFFEKKDFDPKDFLQSIKGAVELSSSDIPRPRSFFRLLTYAFLLMTVIVLPFLGVLLWSVKQISDPQTQQMLIQVGGVVIVLTAVFATAFAQNTKLENIIESVSKIWRG
jgi:CheY-like chemotaxis protein